VDVGEFASLFQRRSGDPASFSYDNKPPSSARWYSTTPTVERVREFLSIPYAPYLASRNAGFKLYIDGKSIDSQTVAYSLPTPAPGSDHESQTHSARPYRRVLPLSAAGQYVYVDSVVTRPVTSTPTPRYGIAQGSLIVLFGYNMAPANWY